MQKDLLVYMGVQNLRRRTMFNKSVKLPNSKKLQDVYLRCVVQANTPDRECGEKVSA